MSEPKGPDQSSGSPQQRPSTPVAPPPAGQPGPYPPYYDPYEPQMSLADYIEILLRRKWLIILGTLGCVLATGLWSISRPRTYQAEALVVVSPAITTTREAQQGEGQRELPVPGVEIVVPGLAAQTYQVLAKSDELLRTLADSLIQRLSPEALEGLTGTRVPSSDRLAEQLSEGLQVELMKETVKAKSPLLRFTFASSEESVPVVVVNLWTELFLRRHLGLSSNVTDEFYQRVATQYEKARASLEQGEEELREVKAGYQDLSIVKGEMALKSTRLDSALTGYQRQQTELEAKERELQHVNQVLADLEEDGQWIVNLPPDRVAALAGGAGGRSGLRQELLQTASRAQQLQQDSLVLWQRQERQSQAFESGLQARQMAFERDHQIDQARKQFGYLDSTLTQFRGELAAIDEGLRQAENQLQAREAALATEPPFLVVAKAVTDEALWNRVSKGSKVAPDKQKELGQYSLQSEEVNPVYQDLAGQVSSLRVQVATQMGRKGYLEANIPVLHGQFMGTRSRLDTLEVLETTLLQAIAAERAEFDQAVGRERAQIVASLIRSHEAVDQSRAYYLALKRSQAQLQRDLAALREEVGFYRSSFERWGGDVRGLANRMDSLELQRSRLERDIEVNRTTFARFSRLQEEARIAREQASGDIQVVSRATSARGIARGTVKRVTVAALVASMVLGMLVFVMEYVRKSRAESGALA